MLGQAQIPTQTKCLTSTGMGDPNASSINVHEQITLSLMEDLKRQIEFYFSPMNFPRDTYLQNLAATYGGFVPLASILGFPRVRQLVGSAGLHSHDMDQHHAEMRLLASALESSKTLAITHDGLWIYAPFEPMTHYHQPHYGMVPSQNNDKGNIPQPFNAVPMQPTMYAQSMQAPYNSTVPHNFIHGLQMDHPQHLLPKSYPASLDGSASDNQNGKRIQPQHRRKSQVGSTSSAGGNKHNNNSNGQKNKKKGKGRNKNQSGSNSVASSSNSSNADGAKNNIQQQDNVQGERQNKAWTANGSSSSSNNTNGKTNDNTTNKSSKNKKKQKNTKKGKSQQQGDRSSILSEEFPSLTKDKKTTNQKASAKPANGGYAQALLKTAPVASGGSSEDSQSTATTVNSEMEKLAISDDNCW